MAQVLEYLATASTYFWIIILILDKGISKKTQTFYMEGADCGDTKYIGGATVYSHINPQTETYYRDNIECRLVFKAENEDWKIMMQVVELDIPDRSLRSVCNDALYVYDSARIYNPMVEAGSHVGLCGKTLPRVMVSSGPYLTIHFRTDSGGPKGKGFKLVVTAFSDDYKEYDSCGANFLCDNKKCIDVDLKCDSTDHCFDKSDEADGGSSKCVDDPGGSLSIWEQFLSMGVTAAVVITVGSLLVLILCIVAITCCCCRKMRKKREEDEATVTSATAVTRGGGPQFPSNQQPQIMITYGPKPGFGPVAPAHPHFAQAGGYQPMQATQCTAPGIYLNQTAMMYAAAGATNSPYHRDGGAFSSSQDSSTGYSSQPPARTQRSYTPTSSRSNQSNSHSSVTYSSNTDKVTMPVHL
ncbi:uncharacterized protein LOC106151531 isoform X1 [Lingula anatina]|uniref:Uncharacterized protein LOC106151531 isoform X1 n=1 Tax=Lingula anatina TaxID=7574 RepID=A0A1S3H2R2_LINAN|nr:uncharacterized protein LOC106151531 isoform X1 [Lingula anatina]|eukprot:XP_013380303.1 uncharacterized protein LOC106151531 isoform X1 [Lingula anatina]